MTLLLTDRAQRYKLWIETFEKSCSEHDATQQMCVYPTVLPAPTRDSALLILWRQATLRRDVDGGSAPRRWHFRSLWRVAGSSGSDSDSRPRVDEFGKQSWAVNALPRCCRSESPALIRTGPPLWSIFCGQSPDRADLTPGSGVGAKRRHSHSKT